MNNGMKTRKMLFCFVFLAPGVLVFCLIYAYPLITIFITSFTNWNFRNLASPEFIGFGQLFDNYKELFTSDYYFKTAMGNSLKWTALTSLIQVPFALLVAIVLSKKPRGWSFTRNVFIIPNIISSAAIGLIFLNLYDPQRGFVTLILQNLTGNSYNLLAYPESAFWCVTFSFVLFGGTVMLLMLAQIMAIPKELYEAANIDGATGIKQDLHITLPLMKSAIGTALILASNYGLLLYNEIALITKGGPDGATYSLSYYIYKTAMGSNKLNFGLANTAGVVMFIIGIIIVGVLNYVFNREDRT